MTKKSVIPVLIVYFLYAVSFTLVVPAFPSLLLQACEIQLKTSNNINSMNNITNNYNDNIKTNIDDQLFNSTLLLTNTTLIYKDESINILSASAKVKAGAKASLLYGIASFIKYFFEFFSSPLLGNISDSYGRKIVLLLSLFAFCFEFLILALYPSVLSVFITRGISGLLDNTTSNIHAIVTDIAYYNNESVTKKFGAIGAVFGLGFIIGPVAGSYLASKSLSLCFFTAGINGLIGFLITVFFLEETNINMRLYSHKRANPIMALRFFLSNKLLATLAIPYSISHINTGIYFIWVLYMQTRLKASIVDIGLFLSSSGIMVVLVQGFLIQIVIPIIWSDERATVVCLLLASIQMLLYGVANNIKTFYIIMILFCPSTMYGPALKSLLVKAAYGKGLGLIDNDQLIDEAGQGSLQGALGSVRTVTAGIGSILFTTIFSFSMNNVHYNSNGAITSKLSGFPYFIAFILYLIATLYTNQILAYYNSNDAIRILQFSTSKPYDLISEDANDSMLSIDTIDEEYEALGFARISNKKVKRTDSIELPDFPVPKVSTPGLGLGTHSDDGSLIGDVPVVTNQNLIKKRDKSNSDNHNVNDSSDERMTLLPHNNKDKDKDNNNGILRKSLKYSGDENDHHRAGKWVYLKKDLRQNQRDNDKTKIFT